MTQLTKIVLHGRLIKFWDEISLGVDTPAQAIQALMTIKPEIRDELKIGSYRVVRGSLEKGFDIDTDMFGLKFGHERELHIIPDIQGNSKGTAKIIIGAILIVAAVAIDIATGGAATPLIAGLAFTSAASVGVLGVGILLSGISEAIAPQPYISANDTSYLLSGQINVTQQGVCVPVMYGFSRVGSVVGAASYTTADFTPSESPESTTAGTYTATSGNSGYVGFGGGGKGSGGSGGSAPDTLHSKATVTIMDILSEGEIGGLENGPQSIFFNNVPLLASDGTTWNFLGVSWQICLGTPDQTPIPGFPGATTTTPVGVEFYHATPYVITTPVTTADEARVTIELPGLYSIDQNTGYVSSTNVSLTIEAGVGSSYTTVITDNINGKCSTAYQRSYKFSLPGYISNTAQSFNIRITRTTADSTTSVLVNQSYIAEYDLITNHQIMYSDTAYIVLTVDAESFGNSIPQRSYGLAGVKVAIPANYNPVTRVYSTTGVGTSGGTWDGVTTTLATTSNNAWCFLDLISNPRYGMNLASSALVNTKFDLYVIAQYCDGLVSDGFGGTEPRYQFNGVLNVATNSWTILQTFASTFRGMIYWGGGQVIVTADMPLTPIKLITQANVLGGTFTYEGTPLNSRHNQATVQWLDPNSQYQQSYEVVDNQTSLASTRGLVGANLVGYGVTSRGLAHRLGQWLLYSDNNQIETVTYTVAFDQLDVRPGQIVAIMDNRYAGARMGGRIRSGGTTTAIPLDSVFTPPAGASSYSISLVNPNGTLVLNSAISSFSTGTDGVTGATYSIAELSSAIPTVPNVNAVYIITANNLSPRQFQVISVQETQRGQFTVFAVVYDSAKFTYIEDGLAFVASSFSTLPTLITSPLPSPIVTTFPIPFTGSITGTTLTISAITNTVPITTGAVLSDSTGDLTFGTVIETYLTGGGGLGTYTVNNSQTVASETMVATVSRGVTVHASISGVGINQDLTINVSWIAPSDVRVIGYKIMVINSEGNAQYYTSSTTSYEIDNLPPDTYTVYVASIAKNGVQSAYIEAGNAISPTGTLLPITSGAAVVSGTGFGPAPITGLAVQGNIRNNQLTWTAPATGIVGGYTIFRNTTATLGSAITLGTSLSTSYVDSDYANLPPGTVVYYWVQAFSPTGQTSSIVGPVSTTSQATQNSYNASTTSATTLTLTIPVQGRVVTFNVNAQVSSLMGSPFYLEITGGSYSSGRTYFTNSSGSGAGFSFTCVDNLGQSGTITYTLTLGGSSPVGAYSLTFNASMVTS